MNETKKLVELIIEGIQEKKGSGIVVVNLENIDGAICRYFIICQGNSPQQVAATSSSAKATRHSKWKPLPNRLEMWYGKSLQRSRRTWWGWKMPNG